MSKQKSKFKKTYLIKIDYDNTLCPVCKQKGDYRKEGQYMICKHCECILEDPYPYHAGERHNVDIRFAQKYVYPKEDEEK